MAKTTPYKASDSDDILELALRLRDVQLRPQDAGLLIDLIGVATTRFEQNHPQNDQQAAQMSGGASNAPAGSAAAGHSTAISVVSAPPAYATQGSVTTPVAATPSPAPTAATTLQATVPATPPPVQPAVALAAAPVQPVVQPVPAQPAVAQPVPAQPSVSATNNGHHFFQVLPANYAYVTPPPGTPGPYYVITRGRVVGIVAGWDRASPHCIGVGGAVFRSVPSVDAGRQLVESALAAGACMLLP